MPANTFFSALLTLLPLPTPTPPAKRVEAVIIQAQQTPENAQPLIDAVQYDEEFLKIPVPPSYLPHGTTTLEALCTLLTPEAITTFTVWGLEQRKHLSSFDKRGSCPFHLLRDSKQQTPLHIYCRGTHEDHLNFLLSRLTECPTIDAFLFDRFIHTYDEHHHSAPMYALKNPCNAISSWGTILSEEEWTASYTHLKKDLKTSLKNMINTTEDIGEREEAALQPVTISPTVQELYEHHHRLELLRTKHQGTWKKCHQCSWILFLKDIACTILSEHEAASLKTPLLPKALSDELAQVSRFVLSQEMYFFLLNTRTLSNHPRAAQGYEQLSSDALKLLSMSEKILKKIGQNFVLLKGHMDAILGELIKALHIQPSSTLAEEGRLFAYCLAGIYGLSLCQQATLNEPFAWDFSLPNAPQPIQVYNHLKAHPEFAHTAPPFQGYSNVVCNQQNELPAC